MPCFELTEGPACSLKGGVERLAFSVLWELTPAVDTVAVRFTKSVIKSRAALTYEAAQLRIDACHGDDERAADDVDRALCLLMKVARVLRQRRCASGCTSTLQQRA